MAKKTDEPTSLESIGLAAPAIRVLEGAGFKTLEQLAHAREEEIAKLHGMGPNAMAILKKEMHQREIDFMRGQFVKVGQLQMYYEVQGEGQPLVMLHGGMLQSGVFYKLAPALAHDHKVITLDQQGHGRTADIDRPLDFEQMADDTAELLEKLGVKQAVIFGYSEGGCVALNLAIRHPKLVSKLILGSSVYKLEGYRPEVQKGMKTMTAKIIPRQMRYHYQLVAPQPEKWPELVEKSAEMARNWQGIDPEKLKKLEIPVFVFMADRDYMSEDHGRELASLLGAEFHVLAKSSHTSYLFSPKKLLEKLTSFLNKK